MAANITNGAENLSRFITQLLLLFRIIQIMAATRPQNGRGICRDPLLVRKTAARRPQRGGSVSSASPDNGCQETTKRVGDLSGSSASRDNSCQETTRVEDLSGSSASPDNGCQETTYRVGDLSGSTANPDNGCQETTNRVGDLSVFGT